MQGHIENFDTRSAMATPTANSFYYLLDRNEKNLLTTIICQDFYIKILFIVLELL